MACNTSSALALEAVRKEFNFPILGVVLPGARAATKYSHRVGVISTLATAKSDSYRQAIQEINPSDEVIEDKGVKVFIDSAAVMYLVGTEMDYKKDQFSSSFVFNNPNETERCGCGESFKI